MIHALQLCVADPRGFDKIPDRAPSRVQLSEFEFEFESKLNVREVRRESGGEVEVESVWGSTSDRSQVRVRARRPRGQRRGRGPGSSSSLSSRSERVRGGAGWSDNFLRRLGHV